MYGSLLLFALCLVGPAFLGWMCLGGCIPNPVAQEKIAANVVCAPCSLPGCAGFDQQLGLGLKNESMTWFQRGSSLGALLVYGWGAVVP